jgi:hypothetical protein
MVPGKERHKREPIADRWQRLSNLSETMKGFFLNKHAQLKALGHSPAEDLSEEEAKQLAHGPSSMRKHLEAKSLQLHQERVTRYKQIYDLSAKKVAVTAIARQVGVSRESRLRVCASATAPRTDPYSSCSPTNT